MAGLSDVNAGMKLDPQTLAKILAMRKGQGVSSGGGQVWYDSNLKTDDPNAYMLQEYLGQRPMENQGDAGTMVADPSLDQRFITKLRQDTGGKLGDRWDTDGNYLGTVELNSGGGRDFNQAVALMAGGYLGGSYATGTGPFAGGATTGGLQSGGLMEAMGGTTPVSGGTAAAGGGVQAGGLMEALGGTTPVSGGTAATAGGTAATSGLSSAAKTGADVAKTAVASNGWEQLAKVGTGLVASTLAGDALSDPVDTSRYDRLFDNLLSEQALASQRGKDLWADYTNIWKPAQQKFADTAMNYDTAGRREQAAQNASGAVASEYDQQRSAATRDMQMAGVDPSTIAALGTSSQAWEAKDRAGAANAARDNVEKTGLNLLKGVVDQGNVVQNQATQQSQVATGTTQAASGILNSQANQQNQNTQNRNAIIGDLFNAGATAYGMYTSSKKTKHVGGKVDGLAAAKAVEKSPAKKWAYKKGQGDGDTRQRMGPMAEDLKREAPQVSDGKKVDGIAQLGLHHAAIGGLSKRLERIEKKLGGLAEARRA